MIRVLLVDDHDIVRKALARLLRLEPDMEVRNGKAAVDQARVLQPDIVLMDINMPVMNGVEATRAICTECLGLRVIGLSMHDEVHAGCRCRRLRVQDRVTGDAARRDPPERDRVAHLSA